MFINVVFKTVQFLLPSERRLLQLLGHSQQFLLNNLNLGENADISRLCIPCAMNNNINIPKAFAPPVFTLFKNILSLNYLMNAVAKF